MDSATVISTTEAVASQQARMVLEVAGVLSLDDEPNANVLIADLVERGWQVGVDQEPPLALPAESVAVTRHGVRHAFWADQVAVGLALAPAAALRGDERLTPHHDEGGLRW